MSDDNQHHPLAESLSALMDNQASELELQRILKASENDGSVKLTWARYQAISASLRGERAGISSEEFTARLSAAIDAEPAYAAQANQKAAKVSATEESADKESGYTNSSSTAVAANEGWWYSFGKVAVAASVVFAVVLSAKHFTPAATQSMDVASVATPTNNTSVNLPAIVPLNTRSVALQSDYEMRPQETRRVQFQPRVSNQGQAAVSEEDVARYVNQLIQVHSDNAAQNSGQGVLPYARVILTEDE